MFRRQTSSQWGPGASQPPGPRNGRSESGRRSAIRSAAEVGRSDRKWAPQPTGAGVGVQNENPDRAPPSLIKKELDMKKINSHQQAPLTGRRQARRLSASLLVVALSLVACGTDETSGDAGNDVASPAGENPSSSASGALTDDQCSAAATSADTFKVGGILPLTGNLSFQGPPEIGGVGLAVSDINAAGGVNGNPACFSIQDSGDSTDLSISTASAGTLIAGKPSVVIGAASSSVSLNVVDTFADNKITEISPANTRRPVRLLAVLLPHRPAGRRPGQRAGHPDQPGRLHQRRLPGLQ